MLTRRAFMRGADLGFEVAKNDSAARPRFNSIALTITSQASDIAKCP
jgi:hypothetical protein